MRKLNIEIHPYATKGLSPRHHISQTKFRHIREDKMDALNECCEACGETDIKMELHEAATIKNKRYVLNGFYLLCRKCHDMVHCFSVSCNRFGVRKGALNYAWKHGYDIKGRSRFKTKAAFSTHVHRSFERVFDFMMADRIGCDYSAASKYGLDPNELKAGFERNYNHFASRIRYMADYLWWLSKQQDRKMNLNRWFYASYDQKKKVKDRIAIMNDEYLKHKAFYDDNKVLYGISCPEREKTILDYAEAMRAKV